jgi:DNA-binding response OmpR family regulator
VRRKLEPDAANPRFVKTVTGVGYSFSSTEAEGPS